MENFDKTKFAKMVKEQLDFIIEDNEAVSLRGYNLVKDKKQGKFFVMIFARQELANMMVEIMSTIINQQPKRETPWEQN